MKLEGKIQLQKTPGRRDKWVSRQLDHDYFLSFEIKTIDGKSFQGCKEAFSLLAPKMPTLATEASGALNYLFHSASLPQNAKDVLHITLGNFTDFRKGRDVANELDEDRVDFAKALEGQLVSLDVSDKAFEIVTTTPYIDKLVSDGASIFFAQSVGRNRDTILSLQPLESDQARLKSYARKVFGDDFELWDSRKQPVPFHVTVGEASITPVLDTFYADGQEVNNTRTSASRLA